MYYKTELYLIIQYLIAIIVGWVIFIIIQSIKDCLLEITIRTTQKIGISLGYILTTIIFICCFGTPIFMIWNFNGDLPVIMNTTTGFLNTYVINENNKNIFYGIMSKSYNIITNIYVNNNVTN